MEIKNRPNPNEAFPNPKIPSLCFIKNVVKNPRIIIGDYTYYDDVNGADQFEKRVTHFYDFIGDRLIIGKFCIEDALNATKAAVLEGIVTGGGSALAEIYKEVKPILKSDITDVQRGMNVVIDSLTAPLYQIAENSGFSGKNIVEEQLQKESGVGFDAKTGVWTDMYKSGIVDPTKVTRSAILNAASIAGLFLTTEAAVGSLKEKEAKANQEMY